jgi:type I restriction enzyme S subunit
VGMMSKKSPQLRFEGFTDDWEERKLENIAQINKGIQRGKQEISSVRNELNPYPVYNGGKKASGYTDECNRENSVMVSEGGASAGYVNYYSGKYWSGGHNFTISNDTKHDTFFLLYVLQKSQEKLYKLQVGTGLPNIQLKSIKDFPIYSTSNTEQQKIGSFFKQLDNTIALHQRKLDLLKEQKKGFLQKMFPKNGAKVPELRFAGFADDWEQRKLGEVIDIENGYAFKSEYFSDEEKRHIVLTPGSVKIGGGFQKDKGRYYDVSGVFPEKFIFKPGNIFITMTDLTPTAQSLGYPAIVPRDDNVYLHNQRLGKIINNTTNPEFLYTLLTTDTYHKEIVSSASGTTVKHSSVSKILDFKSAIPNIDEQKLIGSFFKELDNTIALHQRKLDLLKEQKKGFLQKMFV